VCALRIWDVQITAMSGDLGGAAGAENVLGMEPAPLRLPPARRSSAEPQLP
jgi:hypothetical protein